MTDILLSDVRFCQIFTITAHTRAHKEKRKKAREVTTRHYMFEFECITLPWWIV